MVEAKRKVLIVGNVNGEVKKLCSLAESIQKQKGAFDAMFCVGKFFPPTVKVRISVTYIIQELAELKREVDTRTRMPVDTYFVDSTALIAPFMIKGEHSFFKNLQFLGRSGIKMICGLRVAFVSGLDSDLLGSEVRACDPTKSYVGNYFVQSDIDKVIDDYDKLFTESGKPGVDILMTCQWPLNITGNLTDPNVSAESAKQEFYSSSESLQYLSSRICPRYIYSSCTDAFIKRAPYLNSAGFLSRFIALGSVPGSHKPVDSKSTYIQAIEIEPLSSMTPETLRSQQADTEFTTDPFQGVTRWQDPRSGQSTSARLALGEAILKKQEKRPRVQQQAPQEQQQVYERDGNLVYIGGFDSHIEPTKLEEFVIANAPGKLTQFQYFEGQKGRPFAFIRFEQVETAEKFIANNDGVLTLEGRLLKINFKMKRVKVQEDKDCWFCFDNPTIDRDLIIDSSFTYFYIAVPKGPVSDEHFLIVPKTHLAHSLELSGQMEAEFNAIKQKLKNYIEGKKMDWIMFERNCEFKFVKAAHMNVQIIGLQTVDLQLDERVRKLLKSADGSFIELEKESDLRAELCDDPTRRFFYLEVPGLRTAIGRQKIRFYKELRQGTPFDMQFGRVLACHLLNTKAKLNWQNCTLPKDQEQALVAKFRKELTD